MRGTCSWSLNIEPNFTEHRLNVSLISCIYSEHLLSGAIWRATPKSRQVTRKLRQLTPKSLSCKFDDHFIMSVVLPLHVGNHARSNHYHGRRKISDRGGELYNSFPRSCFFLKPMLGPLSAIFRPSCANLAPFSGPFGAITEPVGDNLGAIIAPRWTPRWAKLAGTICTTRPHDLGLFWAHRGPALGHLPAILRQIGGHPGAILGRSWGRSWSHLPPKMGPKKGQYRGDEFSN